MAVHKRDIVHFWGSQSNMAADLGISPQAITRWKVLTDRQLNEVVGAGLRSRRLTCKQARQLLEGVISDG